MNRTFVSALALAAGLAACAPTMASTERASPSSVAEASAAAPAETVWPHQESDLTADPAVRYGVLANGMRYAIRRNATPPGEASLRLRIDAGSLYEAENQRGVAHFLEHMVLNGTTNVPEGEFVRRLERHGLRFGPDTNASTGFTQTVYKLDLPETDSETVDTALFLMREVADEATLAASAIDSERGIILSEERTRSTPSFRMLVDSLAFNMPGQLAPNRLPIGSTEVIRTAPRERFVEFYEAYYRPERATLIVVGDFDVDAMEAKIRNRFGSWQGEGEAGPEPDLGSVAGREPEARIFVESGVPERISLSWASPPDLRPDTRQKRSEAFVRRIGEMILERRLERIAATMTPAPFIAAAASHGNQAESIRIAQVYATVRPGEWRPALQAIEQEQRRLVEHGVTQNEIDLVVGGLRTARATAVARSATQQSRRHADRLVEAVDEEDVQIAPELNLEIFEATIRELTPQIVQERARATFTGDGPLIYLSTSEPVEGGEAALLAAYREAHAVPVTAPEARETIAWPYTSFGEPGEVAERREIADLGVTHVVFDNGVRLTIKPTDFADDEILVQVRTGDGRGNMPADRPSPQWALGTGFVMGGLRRLDFEQLRDVLAARSIGVNSLLFDESFTLIGRTRPQDFETQLQVLAAYVSEPGWDPTGWNRLRANAQTTHREYEATPGGIYEREAARLLHNGDRRWATPSLEEMQGSSIDDIRRLFEHSLAREPLEVIVIGDITVDEAIARTAATFGALPDRLPETDVIPPVDFPAGTAEPVRLTHGGRADQGLAMVAWPTLGLLRDTAQSRALSVLASVYRLRLQQRIREELGTTYSPVVSQVTSNHFENFGFLFGRIEAPPAALDEFLGEAQAIARDLVENPVSADELERARRPMVEGLQRTMASNVGWQYILADIGEDPRVADAIRNQLQEYESVTPASLRETARLFLRPQTAWKLVIEPRASESAAGASPEGE